VGTPTKINYAAKIMTSHLPLWKFFWRVIAAQELILRNTGGYYLFLNSFRFQNLKKKLKN